VIDGGTARAPLPRDASRGLTSDEARLRLAEHGPNLLAPRRRESLPAAFLEELTEPMILLLLLVGVLYGVWGELPDTITIFAVIVALVGVEVGNERRAERAIAALRELSAPTAHVLRDGRPSEVRTHDIVPGDVVLLEPGARVPADARLLESRALAVDESTLTGESVAVEKRAGEPAAGEDGSLFVRAGTTLVRGHATAIVTATGSSTELGRLSSAAAEAKPPRTPLQVAMRELSRSLVWVALGVSVLVPVLGAAVGGSPLRSMVLVGLALAFATIPEEMPIILTMVLALGGYRLSRRRAVVKRLRAVETLGAVTFVATDKTGTITENRMRVAEVEPEDFSRRILEVAALACGQPTSDPTELGLIEAAAASGIDLEGLRAADRVVGERSFDEIRRVMSVTVETAEARRLLAKGAPEAILAASTRRLTVRGVREMDEERRRAAMRSAGEMAERGLRVLAVAERDLAPDEAHGAREDVSGGSEQPAEESLIFLGLVALADPPREGVREAISACRKAGIRVAMLTGDHPATAVAVAGEVGLEHPSPPLVGTELDRMDDAELGLALGRFSVFARISPTHKLRIVEAARAGGALVAVTGDGVNDAPALASADVGIAMGRRGTDVARAEADIVLADDDFGTLVHAIEEGRVLFRNLRKGVRYYLACKVALIASMLVPAVLGIPLPFAPVQIVLMELFMDIAASAAFVAEPGEADTMRRAPRDRSQPFLDGSYVRSILAPGAGLFAAVTAAYLVTRSADPAAARTVAFVTWLLGHFLLAVNLRSERQPLASLGPLSNRLMLAWGAAVAAAVLLAVLVPALHEPLRTVGLTPAEWGGAVAAAVAGTGWIEARKWIARDGPGARRQPEEPRERSRAG
jgi:Ca2+-transporting ATPase